MRDFGGCPVARDKDPEFPAIGADEFARNARVVPALRFKILGVREPPRTPRRWGIIELELGGFPPSLGIL